MYDFIDKHIQHLDEDLRSLISEIQADKSRIGLPDEQAACAQLGIELKRGVRKGSKAAPALAVEADAAAAAAAGKDKKRHKGKKKEDELGSEALLGGACAHAVPPCMVCDMPRCVAHFIRIRMVMWMQHDMALEWVLCMARAASPWCMGCMPRCLLP